MAKIRGASADGVIRIPIHERDDDDIDGGNIHLTVICLNYVWDGVAGNWVRMTQP